MQATTVWSKVKAVSGVRPANTISFLQCETGRICKNPSEIVNLLANQFENVSKTSNYEENFQKLKTNLELDLNFSTAESCNYNYQFVLSELEIAIKKSKNSAPGPDTISNHMIKNLSTRMKHTLLTFYNKLWHEGT